MPCTSKSLREPLLGRATSCNGLAVHHATAGTSQRLRNQSSPKSPSCCSFESTPWLQFAGPEASPLGQVRSARAGRARCWRLPRGPRSSSTAMVSSAACPWAFEAQRPRQSSRLASPSGPQLDGLHGDATCWCAPRARRARLSGMLDERHAGALPRRSAIRTSSGCLPGSARADGEALPCPAAVPPHSVPAAVAWSAGLGVGPVTAPVASAGSAFEVRLRAGLTFLVVTGNETARPMRSHA
jgi:hypothetical protein